MNVLKIFFRYISNYIFKSRETLLRGCLFAVFTLCLLMFGKFSGYGEGYEVSRENIFYNYDCAANFPLYGYNMYEIFAERYLYVIPALLLMYFTEIYLHSKKFIFITTFTTIVFMIYQYYNILALKIDVLAGDYPKINLTHIILQQTIYVDIFVCFLILFILIIQIFTIYNYRINR